MDIRIGLDFGGVIVNAHGSNASEDTTIDSGHRMEAVQSWVIG